MAGNEPSASAPPLRLMNFVSEEQLSESKKTRGERVEDGTAQRDRPLFEILKENKDKKDAEFNERFKHRPPKALDEDETEFLDKVEMTKREYERQIADEEAQQLRSFQAAVEAQSSILHENKEAPSVPKVQLQEKETAKRKKPSAAAAAIPLRVIVKVKPQSTNKKGKTDTTMTTQKVLQKPPVDDEKPPSSCSSSSVISSNANVGLVLYSDESSDDD